MGLRYEAWTLPWDAAGFKRKVAMVPAIEDTGSGSIPFLGLPGDSSVSIGLSNFTRISEIIDDDTSSLIRVFDCLPDGTNLIIDEWVADRVPTNHEESKTADISGWNIINMFDRIAVYSWDYPENPSRQPDHEWGGENILTNPDFESNAIVSKSFDLVIRAVGGSYILFDGTTVSDVTDPIAFDATASTIENRIETDLNRFADVVVVQTDTSPRTFRIEMVDPPYGVNLGINHSSLVGSVYLLTISATGGTYQLTDGVDDTSAIAYNASASTIETRLQVDITSIIDVVVTDLGTNEDGDREFDIRYVNPTTGTLTVDPASLTGGSASLVSLPLGTTTAVEEGGQTPTGWTNARTLIGVNQEGTYDQFVFSDNHNHTPGGTYSLAIDPGPPGVSSNKNLGAQQVVSVVGGALYQAGIWVYPIGTLDKYRLGLFTYGEELIAWTSKSGQTLTPNQWNLLSLSDVVMPDDVNQATFRIVNTNVAPFSPTIFYIDDAYMYKGLPPTTIGDIWQTLLDDVTIDHAADPRGSSLLWVDYSSFDAVNDSNGVPWNETIPFVASWGSSLMDVLDDTFNYGYEAELVPKATPVGALTHDFNLYNTGGRDSAPPTGLGTHQPLLGGDALKRIPKYTSALIIASDGSYTEDEDATTMAGFGRMETIQRDSEVSTEVTRQLLADNLFAFEAANRQAVKFKVIETMNGPRPFFSYRGGDTIPMTLAPSLAKQNRRVQRIDYVNSQPTQYVVVGSRVFGKEAAAYDLVRRMWRRMNRPSGFFQEKPAPPLITGGGSGGPLTVLVAASNASDATKQKTPYLCNSFNDKEVINAAIAEVQAAPRGGIVQLSEGDFYITMTTSDIAGIVLVGGAVNQNGVSLRGTGPRSTIIHGSGAAGNGAVLIEWTGNGNNEIRDLSVEDNVTPWAAGTYYTITSTNYGHLTNVHGYNLGSTEFHVFFGSFGDEVIISDCNLFGTGSSIELGGGYLHVTSCNIWSDWGIVIPQSTSDSLRISDNIFDCGEVGILHSGPGARTQVLIHDNYFTGGSGIHVADTAFLQDAVINDNVFETDLVGIDFSLSSVRSLRTNISDNIFSNADTAINLGEDAEGFVISSNHFVSLGNVGIMGVWTAAVDGSLVIDGNIFRSGTWNGMELDGGGFRQGLSITSNTFVSINTAAILDGFLGASITDNLLDALTNDGVVADACSDVLFSSNHLYHVGSGIDNTYDGLRLVANCDRWAILGNKIVPWGAGNAMRYGINIAAASCDGTLISNNDLRISADFGTAPINNAGTGTLLEGNITDSGVPSGTSPSFITFSQAGTLSTGTGVSKMVFPVAATILEVQLAVATSPTGADLIVDVHKNGTTIFTTQANRPRVVDGDADGIGSSASADVTSVSEGQYLTVDIDQVGSTIAGEDLTVVIVWEPA